MALLIKIGRSRDHIVEVLRLKLGSVDRAVI